MGRGPLFEARSVIHGVETGAASRAVFERRNPLSQEVVTRVHPSSPAEAVRACSAAAAAFPGWSATSGAERAEILTRAAGLFEERSAHFEEIAAGELGADPGWIRFNVTVAAAILRQAARLPALMEREVTEDTAHGTTNILQRQPAGVVLGLAPWNAPVTLAVRAVAAPLACGNTAVLKGSELCPKTHQSVAELMAEAGLPDGAVNFVANAPDEAEQVVEALIAHPAVRRVNFTGSTRVGRQVAMAAARHLKPCLLELSGKAPLIVLADADLEAAAQAAVYGAFFNQGQICMSTERVIVEEPAAEALAARITELTRSLSAGDPAHGQFDLGTMISAEAAMRVRGLIEDALSKGATLVTGGETAGAVMQPAVIDHVTPAMRLYTEESFGPAAVILRAGSAEEAVSIANDCEFGLSSAIFSADVPAALELAGRIEAGMCHINGPTVHDDPSMPFGGLKNSGYGRFGGSAALHEFTELRWISVQNTPRSYPFWEEQPGRAAGVTANDESKGRIT